MSKQKNLSGKRVREARLRIKPIITQKDLLARLEVRGVFLDSSAISKIELGKIPVSDVVLSAIADALSVCPLWLMAYGEGKTSDGETNEQVTDGQETDE